MDPERILEMWFVLTLLLAFVITFVMCETVDKTPTVVRRIRCAAVVILFIIGDNLLVRIISLYSVAMVAVFEVMLIIITGVAIMMEIAATRSERLVRRCQSDADADKLR